MFLKQFNKKLPLSNWCIIQRKNNISKSVINEFIDWQSHLNGDGFLSNDVSVWFLISILIRYFLFPSIPAIEFGTNKNTTASFNYLNNIHYVLGLFEKNMVSVTLWRSKAMRWITRDVYSVETDRSERETHTQERIERSCVYVWRVIRSNIP